LSLDECDDMGAQKRAAAQKLNLDESRIREIRVRKRSLDARGAIRVRLQCDLWIDEDAPSEEIARPSYHVVKGEKRVIIVGCGPAGMFAALRLIERGLTPVILERGKDVQSRRRDLAQLTRLGTVDPDSNYGFGEGGAGTFSDGKLYTRVKDKKLIAHVLQTLVAHGAHDDILVEAHPHIGSNKLPQIVAALRQSILNAGGEIHFGTRVVDFLLQNNAQQMRGVVARNVETQNETEISGDAVILATGHSARDIFELLHARKILIEAKPFAGGVRIEHPQPLIDRTQYRGAIQKPNSNGEWRHPKLPAASYRVATTIENRGVFSFCMCPGGWIVPAATAPGEIVVNGMSLSRRDSPFANSGLVVAIETEDLKEYESHGALAGLRFQQSLEAIAFNHGAAPENSQRAPAQRASDFIANKLSNDLPPCSYKPGLISSPLNEILPPHIGLRLQKGLAEFGRTFPRYLQDAVLVGVESRTSSPVRIPRDAQTLQHPQITNLYPCGEGAGYAGGIVSAAIDGVRIADAI